MSDSNAVRKKVLLRTLGSPIVVAPAMIGVTALTAVWALGLGTGIGVFLGLVGLLGAGGAFLTKLVVGGDRLADEIIRELDQRRETGRQKQLDALDRHLTEADNDPRPEAALRDLRALVKAFEEAEAAAGPMHLATLIELRSRINEMFQHCVKSLEQTGRLWATASQLNTAEARKALLGQREAVLSDVQTSVSQLSQTLVGVQSLSVQDGSHHELGRLREELDRSLAVARNVEERVRTLLDDKPSILDDSALSVKPETKG